MLRLLLVEGNPLIRNVLVRRLTREGFQILAASNGAQAIALACAEQPALIILDVDLLILDGWQTTQRLRSLPETQMIPILIVAGSLSGEMRARLAIFGCDAFEPKPIDFPQMIAHIHWLAPQRGAPL